MVSLSHDMIWCFLFSELNFLHTVSPNATKATKKRHPYIGSASSDSNIAVVITYRFFYIHPAKLRHDCRAENDLDALL